MVYLLPEGRRRRITLLLLGAILFTSALRTSSILPTPEVFLSEHFTGKDLLERLPEHCLDTAKRFLHCQEVANETWVMACHRKWCQDFRGGHCAVCTGIGDRMRFLLSLVEDAYDSDRCIRVQIDYPVSGEAVLDTAIYHDPSGWWGELGHYRSYDVSERLRPEDASKTVDKHTGGLVKHIHFIPQPYHSHGYDACLYHILFQPDHSLQKMLDVYNEVIDSHGGPSIGIHYRTGDIASFGLYDTNDTRVFEIESGWKRMLACAEQLAAKLFPGREDTVRYFLATDNIGFKETVQRQEAEKPRGSRTIFSTTVQPRSFRGGMNSERDSLLEIHLLAARTGLVMNGRMEDYKGLAAKKSWFAVLATSLGFIPDDHVLVCSTGD
jgi:hypothetical protein